MSAVVVLCGDRVTILLCRAHLCMMPKVFIKLVLEQVLKITLSGIFQPQEVADLSRAGKIGYRTEPKFAVQAYAKRNQACHSRIPELEEKGEGGKVT